MIEDRNDDLPIDMKSLLDFYPGDFMSNDNVNRIVKQLQELVSDFDEYMKTYSSDIAEKVHHDECEFKCCGEHDDIEWDSVDKCPRCGMTEEQQDSHNDDVWNNIDMVEGGEKCEIMRTFCDYLNSIIIALGNEEVDHV